ncbi:MAG: PAS domain S-box protein [Alphaproteobacteria bacterium]|nr:PAS domain S-box protein [Alphaproteobacteria bacterium]
MTADSSRQPWSTGEHALHVVESMTSGVVTLDGQGRVTSFNHRAQEITGIESRRILGESLVAFLLEDPSNEHLADVIVEAGYDDTGRYYRQADFHRDGRRRVLDLRASLLRDDNAAAVGVVLVIDDVTETALLRAAEAQLAGELKTQNAALADAYRTLEEKNRSLDQVTRRVQLLRVAAVLMALAVFGGAAFYAWTAIDAPTRSRPAATAAAAPSGFVARTQPVRQTVGITGTIEPGQVVEVTAPFAGRVLERSFEYGSRIERGRTLVVLDASEIERERRNAMVTAMKTRDRVAELEGWERGNEVQRARRQLALARQNLERAQQQLQTAVELLGRGIIAKQEHDSLLQQLRQQEQQVFASEQDLAATLRKGADDQITMARLELSNAEEKHRDLSKQVGAARILAPVSGVALKPRAATTTGSGGAADRDIAVGARIEQGRTILEIGDLSSLSVRGQLDEIDVGRVRVGLPVAVSAPGIMAQPLAGRVAAVSSQATTERTSSRAAKARFDVQVRIDEIPEGARESLRIGMSSVLDIIIYENKAAIVIPPDLVRRGAEGARLRVRKGAQGEPRDVIVTLGPALPQGIEITGGLAAGDEVLPP